MSTLTQHHTSPAPWKADFLSHVSSMPSPEFVLSTVSPAPAGATVPYVPRARYCIFRGMWAELPENKHNTAPANPRVYGSDLPTFTTDVRMEKVGELFSTSAGKADRAELLQGSGGGGPVEAVWWVKDKSVQWRVKGEAFVVHAGDIEEAAESSGVRTVKSEVGKRMYVVEGSEGKEGEWSWGREIVGHFGNCSPGMRGESHDLPSVEEANETQARGNNRHQGSQRTSRTTTKTRRWARRWTIWTILLRGSTFAS